MKKTFLCLGLALSLVLGGTAAQAASAADTDGIVFFTGNSSVLGVKAKKEIKAFIEANPNAASFAVTGYVQKAGSDRNNSKLSLARANAVKKYIAKLGNTKTVAVTAGGISPTKSKTSSARRAVLTAVAAVAAAPASYSVGVKTSSTLGNFSVASFVPMIGGPTPDIATLRALVSFDYVKPDGTASTNNTLPADLASVANIEVKPDSNVTLKLAPVVGFTVGLSIPTLPTCVQFVSGLDTAATPAAATEATDVYSSITLKVISTNCTLEPTPALRTSN